jgi:hypothetical protein
MDVERNQPTTPTQNLQENTTVQPNPPITTQVPSGMKRVSPNDDFYNNCYSYSPLIYTFLGTTICMGVKFTVLWWHLRANVDELLPVLFYFVYLYFAVFVAVDLFRHTPASQTRRVAVWTCCFVIYSAVLGYSTFYVLDPFLMRIYFPICGLIVIFAKCKLWYANKVSK